MGALCSPSVPSSSFSIMDEKPTTSSVRIAARRRVVNFGRPAGRGPPPTKQEGWVSQRNLVPTSSCDPAESILADPPGNRSIGPDQDDMSQSGKPASFKPRMYISTFGVPRMATGSDDTDAPGSI